MMEEMLPADDAMKHLHFYKVSECLHRAHRDLNKRKIPIPEWANIMLNEGLHTLRTWTGSL